MERGEFNVDELDLIRAVAKECGLPQYQTYEFLNSLASNIQEMLRKQGSVTLSGLGTFYSSVQSRKKDTVLTAGEAIKYYVTHVPEFHPASELFSTLDE